MKKIILMLLSLLILIGGCSSDGPLPVDIVNSKIEDGTIVYEGNPQYLADAIVLNLETKGYEQGSVPEEEMVHIYETVNNLNIVFNPIVINPEVLPEDISILYNFMDKIPAYQRGEITIEWDEKNAVVGVVNKYLDEESASVLISQIENKCKINMIDDTETDWVATTTIPALVLGTPVYGKLETNFVPVNGINACYQYTGQSAYLQFNAAVPPDLDGDTIMNITDADYNETDNPPATYGVYDDYQDCVTGKESVSTVEIESDNYSLIKNSGEDNKQSADGTIDNKEASEVALVKTGQYVSLNNVSVTLLNYAPSDQVAPPQ